LIVVVQDQTKQTKYHNYASTISHTLALYHTHWHYITHIGIPVTVLPTYVPLMLKNMYRSLPCRMHLIGNLLGRVLCVPLSYRQVCFYCVMVLHRNTESNAHIACFQICILLCHCFVYENFPIKRIKHTHI